MSQPASVSSRFETVAIVGVGLIGGSLAAAIRRGALARTVIGIGRDAARLAAARDRGLIDDGSTSVEAGSARADLIVVCTPVDRIVDDVRRAAAGAPTGALITDAGSVKGTICTALSTGLPSSAQFVGAHPLAGSEKQGFEHADAALFEGRVCVVTPLASTSSSAVDRVRRLWESVGSTVLEMSPQDHDRALAETSHSPHVIAAALAAALTPENARLTASGFRDTTRIAAGDPQLWSAILLANAESVLSSLNRFGDALEAFRRALQDGNGERLRELLSAAKSKRDALKTEQRLVNRD